mmetsp:Transcript_1205/g.1324  ORF Transcript_1205/g.1324 Transcript_1205/m.1324 type:complete len:246 (-) Transcript_1205:521-1258(-)
MEDKKISEGSKPVKWDWRHWKAYLKNVSRPKEDITEETKSYEEILNDLTEEQKKKATLPLYFTSTLQQDRDYEPEEINEFKIIKELGSGAFATVFLVNRRFKENGESKEDEYALKQMRIAQLKKDKFITFTVDREQETMTALQKVYMEIRFMAGLDHPNVIKIYEMIQDDTKDYINLVIELCHFGQISDWNEMKGKYIRNENLFNHLLEAELKDEEFKDDNSKIEAVGRIIFKETMKGLQYLHEK